jgi:hypothetical protein
MKYQYNIFTHYIILCYIFIFFSYITLIKVITFPIQSDNNTQTIVNIYD